MFNLVYGKALSGKTSYIRSVIREKASISAENIIYIVPEQHSYCCESEMLTFFGDDSTGITSSVKSFKKLSKEIIKKSGLEQKPLIDDNCRRVFMNMAVESVCDSLDIFSKCNKNSSVNSLISIADELIQCAVTPEELKSSAIETGDEILIKKAKELSLIINTYNTLVSSGFSQGLDEMTLASKLAGETDFFKDKYVFIDEFSGFTNQEYKFIYALSQKCREVYVTVCTDSIANEKNTTDIFYYTQKTAQKLFSISKKANVPFKTFECTYSPDNINPTVKSIGENLYKSVKNSYSGKCDSVKIIICENIRQEASAIASEIKKLVREKKYRYRDFAVIDRGNRYKKYLFPAFKKYGIPVFEDSKQLLKNESIVRLVADSLSVLNSNFNTEYILRAVKTSLFSIDETDIQALENYLIVWQINGSKWFEDWTNHPDGYGNIVTDESKEILFSINETRKKIIEPFINLKNNLTDADGFSSVRAIFDFLTEINAGENLLKGAKKLCDYGRTDLAIKCESVWDEFMTVLDKFANTVGDRKLTVSRLCQLFSTMISNADIGQVPKGVDEITIGDAMRSRMNNKKVVFAVGANEGIFPAVNKENFIFTSKERQILNSTAIALHEDGDMFVSNERFNVYYTLTRPSQMLCVTYSLCASDGKGIQPSEIVTEVQRCVPECVQIEDSFIPFIERIESTDSAFEKMAEHFGENNSDIASLKEYLSEKEEYSGKIKALERASKKAKAKFQSKEIATEFFGKDMHLSPSAIEKYHKCPFMYFCQYGMRAKKIKKAELASNIRGLAIHEVLEKLFIKYPSNVLCTLDNTQLEKEITDLLNSYVHEKMGAKPDERTEYSLERIRLAIMEITQRLIYEFSNSKFITDEMEFSIGWNSEVKDYVLPLKGGGTISLHGIVDRIDKYETDECTYIRVVDYKTGGKNFNLNDIMSGLNLQMLIYLIALWKNGGNKYNNPMPAGVLYLPAKGSDPKLDRNASEEKILNESLNQGKMNGLVLSIPQVMDAMDTSGEGKFLKSSITGKARGNVKNYAISLERFNLLFNKMNDVIIKTAEDLQNGNIEVFPMLDGEYKNTCNYCDYKAVCCYEENDPYNVILQCEDEILKGEVKNNE